MWSRENAYQLLFNFVASVATIFVNKLVFESFKFRFTTALTAMHYVVTLLGLEMLAAAGMYVKRSSPMTPRILLLSAVVGTAPALNNLSLSLNNLGFYQIVKLLVTPAIVGLEALLYGEKMSWPRAASLLLVCVGVGFACVNDLRLNWGGCVAALLWLPVAAVYKVLWSHVSKEESWHTLALMRRVLPLSTLFLMALVPVIDPPGFVMDPPGFVMDPPGFVMDPPGFVSFEWSAGFRQLRMVVVSRGDDHSLGCGRFLRQLVRLPGDGGMQRTHSHRPRPTQRVRHHHRRLVALQPGLPTEGAPRRRDRHRRQRRLHAL